MDQRRQRCSEIDLNLHLSNPDMLGGMTAKQEAKSLLEKLPDSCSIEDIQYHLYVLEKVRSGLDDARQNGAISQEDAESRLSRLPMWSTRKQPYF